MSLRMEKIAKTGLYLFIMIMLASLAAAQQMPKRFNPDPIDSKIQAEIIDSVTAALNDNYVFPEVAKKMEQKARKLFKDGYFKGITDPVDFVQKLSESMSEVCHDKHFGIRYNPEVADIPTEQEEPTPEEIEAQIAAQRYNNFGFYKLERLEGNVGYLDLRGFNDAKYAGQTAIAAMNFLANSNALIIDLRQNGGGSPSMIQLITSYFFDESKHINSFYLRPEDTIKQFWTQEFVEGPRMSDIPIYILTSGYTFSAAEEFTYNLKNMERATIVGETTGGGAHPVMSGVFPNLNIEMRIPMGRAINPITGTNWEGTGIEPNIAVPEAEALEVAHLEAMKKVLENATDDRQKFQLEWAINTNETLRNPHTVSPELLKKYAGKYGPRKVTLEDGQLYYQREDRPKYKMIPMTDDTFMFAELDYFRLQFIPDEKGDIVAVEGLYSQGRTDRSPRDSGI